MAQHDVTGQTGRTPRQGQRFDWWATTGAPGVTQRAVRPRPAGPRSSVPAQRSLHDLPASQPTRRISDPAAAEVYRQVQQSAAFQDIRRTYRRFVFPATALFMGWYLAYVITQAAAPDLMRTRLAGPFSVAWLLGLLQFVSTFLLTWLYSRNARTKRDRAALGLRWDTQDQLR
ncbi:DUF485 domain-containing protein [Kitasatospora sp. LaBMicrA B282]|uniref:DUF485 domain-containing protein n=1 Tax=Kitasatospora sp. LaBMicrA B282 TaxID=3420949 RepID=UPI003D0F4882